jgi:glycerophosphoryl diester phosphodiesterase
LFDLLNSKPLCIAHRGAASLAPENTLAAARKALELGADLWELDVTLTADGEMVVLHDDSLARTTNAPILYPQRAPWLITTFTLAEVKKLDAGSWFIDSDPFGTIASGVVAVTDQQIYQNEPLPTLWEALAFTREQHWRVNVEIKELLPPLENFSIVEKVVKLIESLDMVEQVLLSSFVHPYMRQAKKLNPTLATAALLDERERLPEAQNFRKRGDFDAVHPHYTSIGAANTQALRQTGLAVNPWTVNDPAEMERLIQAGVTGIITDFPQILKRVIGNRLRPAHGGPSAQASS